MRLEDVTPGGDHVHFQSDCGDTVPQQHSCIMQPLILYDKDRDRRSVTRCYLTRLVVAGVWLTITAFPSV